MNKKSNPKQLLEQLTQLFKGWLPVAGADESGLLEVLSYLDNAGEPNPIEPAMPLVVERWLERCCRQPCAPQHQAAIQTLFDIAPQLHWFTPSADYAGEILAQNYAFVRLIGPPLFDQRSLFDSDKISAGFTIQAPHIFYPSHWHPAVEFYGVLTGTGCWQINDDPFIEKEPGSFIYHPTNIPHAMETTDEPMLTAYSWIGDINTRPVSDV